MMQYIYFTQIVNNTFPIFLRLNKYILYLILIGISSISLSMQTLEQRTYTLTSTNPTQQFIIPEQLVLHSETIKAQITNDQFKKQACLTLENTFPQDVLHLISCLKKIDIITKSKKDLLQMSLKQTSAEQIFAQHEPSMDIQPLKKAIDIMTYNKKNLPKIHEKRNFAKQALTQYISCLDMQELLTLAQNTDYLIINHTHFNKSITQILAKLIIANTSDARSILQSIPDNFHKNVMQELNKQAFLDSKVIQPYSNLIEPTCQAPLLHPQYAQRLLFKARNNTTLSDLTYQPRYYNTQTETTIIRCRSRESNRILNFQISKKDSLLPIIIDTQPLQLESINCIKANEDESLFICEGTFSYQGVSGKNSFIINLNNLNSPLITNYKYYAFKNDEPTKLYVASDDMFGILDTANNTYTHIKTCSRDFYSDIIRYMQLNADQSIIILSTHSTIYIGRKTKNDLLSFEEIDWKNFYQKLTIDSKDQYIRSFCINPYRDQLLVLFGNYKNNYDRFFIIDLISLKPTLLPLSNISVYSNPITFLDEKVLYFCSSHYHYFVNIPTGNHWKKKRHTYHICFTADMHHAFEESLTYSNGKEHRVSITVPLFNQDIAAAISQLNKGNFPLLLFDIAQHIPNTVVTLNEDEYQEYMELKQSSLGKVIDTIYTIIANDRFSYFGGLLRHYCPTKKSIKGLTVAIAFCIIGLTLHRIMDYFNITKQFDFSNKAELVKSIRDLLIFLLKV